MPSPESKPEYFDRTQGHSAEEVFYGDLSVHYLAVTKFAGGKPLSRNEESFLTTEQTNAIAYVDLLGLGEREAWGKIDEPLNKPPLMPIYTRLFKKTSEEYRSTERILLNAVVYKLACYMALIDIITFDFRVKGKPLKRNVKTPIDGQFMENLAKEYGGEMPGLADLYGMALEALKEYSQPGDALLQDILAQGPLPEDRFA